MSAFVAGAALLLGGLLVSAGAMKLTRPHAFRVAIVRLFYARLGDDSGRAALAGRVVAVLEIAVGAGLLASRWAPGAWALLAVTPGVLLYAAFLAVVLRAARLGASCGCFSSLSDGPAGGAELGRATALLLLAVTVLAVVSAGGPAGGSWWLAAVWTVALGALVTAGAGLGVLLARRNGRPARRSSTRTRGPARSLGRSVAFLLGRITTKDTSISRRHRGRPTGSELAELVGEALLTPTGRALSRWLTDQQIAVDWRRARARDFVMDGSAGELLRCIALQATPCPSAELTVVIGYEERGRDRRVAADILVSLRTDGAPVPLTVGGAV